jgi:hypothetical protein
MESSLSADQRVALHAVGNVVEGSGLSQGSLWPTLYYDALMNDIASTDYGGGSNGFDFPVVEIGVGFGGFMDRVLATQSGLSESTMYAGIDPYDAARCDSHHFNIEVGALLDTPATLQEQFDQLFAIVNSRSSAVPLQSVLFRGHTRDGGGGVNADLATSLSSMTTNAWGRPPRTWFVDGQHDAAAVVADLEFIHAFMTPFSQTFRVYVDDTFSPFHTGVATGVATFAGGTGEAYYTPHPLACAGSYSMTVLDFTPI